MRVLVWGVILVVFGLGAWLLSLGAERRAATLAAQEWPLVRATITSAGVEAHPARKGSRAWWNPTWTYRYEFGGQRHEVSSGASAASVLRPFPSEDAARAAAAQRPVGSEVQVAVDPSQPGEAVLDRPEAGDAKWLFFVVLGASVMLVALGGAVAVASRRRPANAPA